MVGCDVVSWACIPRCCAAALPITSFPIFYDLFICSLVLALHPKEPMIILNGQTL